jgi:peptidoglycan hydrolase-like protein with peptidoglycan-binding domain
MPITIRRLRLLLPLVFATLLLAATAPGVAAASRGFPTQSLGNRGADVRAVQGLLGHHGFTVSIDGVFGTTTRDRVTAFQAARGLPATGVVGETTWAKLIVSLRSGSSGEAVKVAQRLLNEKRRAGLTVDGRYGAATRAAVITFQKHVGMTGHGVVGPVTWRNLLWHYDYPAFNSTSLCDYSVGNGRANWGTGAAIGQLEAAARAFATTGNGRVAVGDVGREHGGDIAGHATHEVGLDVDIRPIRKADNQCTRGTNYRYAAYDRGATRALIRAIRAAAPGHVKLIYFNDPVLIGEGLVRWHSGHDDHLHVRYCEASHALARYRC